jgi:trehalose 6-phosphate phosphatase
MQYLFSTAGRTILTRLCRERTLYAFDFDGTLSPIVDHPALAGMRVRTRCLLNVLAASRPCVVISGRARPDLLSKLTGVTLARAIGNHGAETDTGSSALRSRVAQWQQSLELDIGSLPGVWMENKGLSLAVHYRQAPNGDCARHRILAATRKLEDVRVFGGKKVVNLLLTSTPHKGQALAAERDRLNCDWVLYVGDDENDEDAFALDGNIVGVRIGRKKDSHARYFLSTQEEIDCLLQRLLCEAGPREEAVTIPTPALPGTPVGRM